MDTAEMVLADFMLMCVAPSQKHAASWRWGALITRYLGLAWLLGQDEEQ